MGNVEIFKTTLKQILESDKDPFICKKTQYKITILNFRFNSQKGSRRKEHNCFMSTKLEPPTFTINNRRIHNHKQWQSRLIQCKIWNFELNLWWKSKYQSCTWIIPFWRWFQIKSRINAQFNFRFNLEEWRWRWFQEVYKYSR